MNDYPNFVKKTLCSVIDEMELKKEKFVRNPGKDFVRHRTFDFSTIIRFVLSAGCNTLATELMNFFGFKQFPSVSAFVQQRQKVLPEAFHYILTEFNRRMNVSPKLFHGYRLLAVDGSDLTLPFNPKEPENIRTKDHCNFLHLNTIYDVCSRLYVDASIHSGSKNSEASAAVDFVKCLPDKFPVIIVADRGYENYNLFAHVEERLFDYVIRIKDGSSNGILSGISFPEEDEFDIIQNLVITRKSSGPAAVNPKTYKYFTKAARFDFIESSKAPDYEIQIRFVRFKLDSGEYEVLATSLPQDVFTAEDLKELYHMRWNIETSYLLSKWVLGMVCYHSKKAENVKQEVYADLIMYNFVMYICAHLKPKKHGKKHPRQINFTQAIKICLHFFRAKEGEQAFDVESTILRFLLPIRSGRSYQRKAVSKSVVGFNYRLS